MFNNNSRTMTYTIEIQNENAKIMNLRAIPIAHSNVLCIVRAHMRICADVLSARACSAPQMPTTCERKRTPQNRPPRDVPEPAPTAGPPAPHTNTEFHAWQARVSSATTQFNEFKSKQKNLNKMN